MALRALAWPFIRFAERLYRRPNLRRLATEMIEEFDSRVPVDTGVPPMRLHVASRMEHQRALGVFDKEPDTIAWLDQLREGDLFLDIGANIGVYTIYAAVRRKARVIALEPESQNFSALNRNIHANNVADRVIALPIAASDESGTATLHLSHFQTGGSHHSAHAPIGEDGNTFTAAYVQGTVAMPVVDLIAGLDGGGVPRFVKIDVDGAEARVVKGMKKLLPDAKLEQILIEMATDKSKEADIISCLEAAGFRAGPPQSEYHGRGNHIFARQENAR